MRVLRHAILVLCLAPGVWMLHAQETGPDGQPVPVAERPVAEEKPPTSAQQMLERIKQEEIRGRERIKEIEGIVFPIQDEIAQKLFFFSPGEFAFLRLQSEAGKTTGKYFEAQSRIDQDSLAGVADALDAAYEAMRSGNLWVGRESSLVAEDAALFNDLNTKVMEAIRKRPDGDKIMALIEERNRLMARQKNSGPMMKYLGERRLWWKSYPEYMKAVEAAVTAEK